MIASRLGATAHLLRGIGTDDNGRQLTPVLDNSRQGIKTGFIVIEMVVDNHQVRPFVGEARLRPVRNRRR